MSDMVGKQRHPEYFNRELSWLAFNRRVLAESNDLRNPVLERLKFLAISASNLDEFFMIRVGGLNRARKAGRTKKDPSGMTPREQLREIYDRSKSMMNELHRCFAEEIAPALEKGGIRHVGMDQLSAVQEDVLLNLFKEELYPVVTPIALKSENVMPNLQNLGLHILVRLKSKNGSDRENRYAIMSLNRAGARIVPLPAERGFEYVLCEEVMKKYAADWFPGYEVKEGSLFRITRNADFSVQENEAPDLLSGMEEVLEERKSGECIRLEVESDISASLLSILCDRLPVTEESVFPLAGVLNMKELGVLALLDGFDELKAEPWPAQASPHIVPNEPMFDQIAKKDLLLYHPYESFDPVIRFVEEAAADSATMAMKMVLYRTSSDSAVIAALKRAAENGVNVTVLMELKARFDEARNMSWARDLEQCGVQVIYGVKGYKTHAKICMVVRREPVGVVRYCHFGTGNYNESTAKLYGDISYLTCNPDLGGDASAFFNALCGYAQPRDFNLVSMAPVGMRDRLLALMDYEIKRAERGKKAFVRAKINALVDVQLSEKLYEAARVGVKIQLNVRGICCLKPTENIAVTSIVGRNLEHARIFHFHHGGEGRVYISSADWMPRNLDKRLELMIPVVDQACKERLIQILDVHLSDNRNSWRLQSTGVYDRVMKSEDNNRSQEVLYRQACEAVARAKKGRRTHFEPHRPPDSNG